MFEMLNNFFSSVSDVIEKIVSFFRGFLDGMVTFFKIIPNAVNTVTSWVESLPTVLKVFAVVTLTISVIYLILGRDTGGNT